MSTSGVSAQYINVVCVCVIKLAGFLQHMWFINVDLNPMVYRNTFLHSLAHTASKCWQANVFDFAGHTQRKQ